MCNITGGETSTSGTATLQDKGFDPTGWELALVTTPSTNTNSMAMDSNLVGFLTLSLRIFMVSIMSRFGFGNCYSAVSGSCQLVLVLDRTGF